MQWFLVLLEFDFTIVVKKGITHQQVDHLSRLMHGEEPKGILDDLPSAYLFNVKMVPKWSKDIMFMLTKGTLCLSRLVDANLSFIKKSQHYYMIHDRLYQGGQNLILRPCIDNNKEITYMKCTHVAIGNVQLSLA